LISDLVIDARGISKSYQRGVPMLDDVALSLRRDEMVNGCERERTSSNSA
jgi:hypothetical protein